VLFKCAPSAHAPGRPEFCRRNPPPTFSLARTPRLSGRGNNLEPQITPSLRANLYPETTAASAHRHRRGLACTRFYVIAGVPGCAHTLPSNRVCWPARAHPTRPPARPAPGGTPQGRVMIGNKEKQGGHRMPHNFRKWVASPGRLAAATFPRRRAAKSACVGPKHRQIYEAAPKAEKTLVLWAPPPSAGPSEAAAARLRSSNTTGVTRHPQWAAFSQRLSMPRSRSSSAPRRSRPISWVFPDRASSSPFDLGRGLLMHFKPRRLRRRIGAGAMNRTAPGSRSMPNPLFYG